MNKKQLISSLAVTSMIVNPMAGKIFANSNNSSSSTNSETEFTTTAKSSNLSRFNNRGPCASGNFEEGVVGNDELISPDASDPKVVKSENKQYTVNKKEQRDISSSRGNQFYHCSHTNDTFTVNVRKVSYKNLKSEETKYASNENFEINSPNFKLTYKVVDDKGNIITNSEPCENKKNSTRMKITLLTKNGITLGQDMTLEKAIEFNDPDQTKLYEFSYILDGTNHNIDIDVNPIESSVSTPSDLINTLSYDSIKKVKLNKPLIFDDNNAEEVIVGNGVSIDGNRQYIDFQNKGSLTLKGDGITLSDITIKGSKTSGVKLYKCDSARLDNVHVEDSRIYDILVDGSNVTLNNCSTNNNRDGGIMVLRSKSMLYKFNGRDSKVMVTGSLTQNGTAKKVIVKNAKMIDVNKINVGYLYLQDNKFEVSKDSPVYKDYQTKLNIVTEHISFDNFYTDSVKEILTKLNLNLTGYKNIDYFEVTYNYGMDKK